MLGRIQLLNIEFKRYIYCSVFKKIRKHIYSILNAIRNNEINDDNFKTIIR